MGISVIKLVVAAGDMLLLLLFLKCAEDESIPVGYLQAWTPWQTDSNCI